MARKPYFTRLDLAPFTLDDGTLRQCTPRGNCDIVYTTAEGASRCASCARLPGATIIAAGPFDADAYRYCEVCAHTMKPSKPQHYT